MRRLPRTQQIHHQHPRSLQQTRSISLWGWGSSKGANEFSKAHPEPPPAPSSSPVDTTSATPSSPSPPTQILHSTSGDSIRTIKASHATSDAPDPSHSSALENLEQTILGSKAEPVTDDPTELASIPEAIGYLKEACGLDFGWGPTAICQSLLEHLHITAGLSWSAAIVSMALIIRAVLIPAFYMSTDNAARAQEISPVIKELRDKRVASLAQGDKNGAVMAQLQMREISKEANIKYWKIFLPIILQIPLGYGAWHLLRMCSNLPVPAFENESVLWLTNLVAGDPYWILPVAAAGLTWLNIKSSPNSGNNASTPETQQVMNILRIGFPVIAGGFLLWMPGSVQIYFVVNNLLTQVQLTTFNNTTARKILLLHPMPAKNLPPPSSTTRVLDTTARTVSRSAPYRVPRPSSPTPTPVIPPSNKSLLDRTIDSTLSSGKSVFNKALGRTLESEREKAEQRERDAMRQKADEHEANRRQVLESQRMARNAAMMQKNKGMAKEGNSAHLGAKNPVGKNQR
jgi:YidC/Oxa1 family membrane protein insertase